MVMRGGVSTDKQMSKDIDYRINMPPPTGSPNLSHINNPEQGPALVQKQENPTVTESNMVLLNSSEKEEIAVKQEVNSKDTAYPSVNGGQLLKAYLQAIMAHKKRKRKTRNCKFKAAKRAALVTGPSSSTSAVVQWGKMEGNNRHQGVQNGGLHHKMTSGTSQPGSRGTEVLHVPSTLAPNKRKRGKYIPNNDCKTSHEKLKKVDTPNKELQVVIMGDVWGARLTKEGSDEIRSMIVEDMLAHFNNGGRELHFNDSGLLDSGWVRLLCDDQYTLEWVLNWKPQGKSYAVCKESEAPRAVNIYILLRSNTADITRLIKLVAGANRNLDAVSWGHIETTGSAGEWKVYFSIGWKDAHTLNKQGWKIWFELSQMRIFKVA